MGYTSYCADVREVRASSLCYASAPVDVTFKQQRERKIHDSMSPQGIVVRECRDSDVHPNTIPIILTLDVTGSMGAIPRQLIADGLPTMMGTLIQNGVPDASLMFMAIGDHECDRFPLQVGQFESGDEELDMWLTRTYLEGGGGGNMGESYLLAWQFAANKTVTDAFEKRGQKGFLFTVGDEPCLPSIPKSAYKEVFGENANYQSSSISKEELLRQAQEKYNVYHIHIAHRGSVDESVAQGWRDLLGQNLIVIKDHNDLPKTISEIVLSNTPKTSIPSLVVEGDDEEIL